MTSATLFALRASKLGSVIFTKQNSSLVSLPAAQQKPGLRSTDHFVPDPFYSIGLSTLDMKQAYPLTVKTKQPPSWTFPLGTDFFGRNLHAAMVLGLWQTALIGVLAGAIGTFIGVVLGFTSAYFGGIFDAVIKGVCQIISANSSLPDSDHHCWLHR